MSKMFKNGIRRGDVVYVYDKMHSKKPRPAVVVSNNMRNTFSPVVTVVYLTTKPRKPLPTHATVLCKVPSIAMCERIHTISKSYLDSYIRSCTYTELKGLDQALCCSLGIDTFAYTVHNIGFLIKRLLQKIYDEIAETDYIKNKNKGEKE